MLHNCTINLNLQFGLSATKTNWHFPEEEEEEEEGEEGVACNPIQQKENLFPNNNVSLISPHAATDSCSDLIMRIW